MVEFLVCFGSDDESKENKRRKPIKHHFQNKKADSLMNQYFDDHECCSFSHYTNIYNLNCIMNLTS